MTKILFIKVWQNILFASAPAEAINVIVEEDENQPSLYSFALERVAQHVSRIDDTRLFMSGGVVGALPLYLTVPFNLFPESNEPSGSGNGSRVVY